MPALQSVDKQAPSQGQWAGRLAVSSNTYPEEPTDEILNQAFQNGALKMPLAEAMEEIDCILAGQPNLTWEIKHEIRQVFEATWRGHNEEGSTSSPS
jgi:hypothetical protein